MMTPCSDVKTAATWGETWSQAAGDYAREAMTAGSIRASQYVAHCVMLMSADHTATHPNMADERLSIFVARLMAVTHREFDLVLMELETSKPPLPLCLTTAMCITAEHSDDY